MATATMPAEAPVVKLSCHHCSATGRQETYDGVDIGPCVECHGLGELSVKDNFRLSARLGGAADFAQLLAVLTGEAKIAGDEMDRAIETMACSSDPVAISAGRRCFELAQQRRSILAAVAAGLDLYRLPLPGKGVRETPTAKTSKKPRSARKPSANEIPF